MKKILSSLPVFMVFSAWAACPPAPADRPPTPFNHLSSFPLPSYAPAYREDSNIVISNKTERYSFEEGEKTHPVVIRQEDKTTYYCSELRADISWVESYDDQSSIDGVKIYVNGSRDKTIKPKDEYYSSDDIFFSDQRVFYFSLPFLKKGTSDEVEMQKTTLDPRYFTSVYFTEQQAVRQKTVELVIPRWMHVEIKEMNFSGYHIKKTQQYDTRKNADIYVYTITDLPPYKREHNSLGPSYIYPHLFILSKYAELKSGRLQYFNELKDQYAWYRSLVKQIGNDPAVMKTKAMEITHGLTADLDKVKAVYQWVQENVRYIAFENGLAGYRPAKAQEVLSRKYGDCKGMANLTKNLLAALGFDARLCWIGTDHIAYDYSTPSLAVDNHMICALNYQGKFYFLDATETYIGFGQYAQRIQGRQVLIENGDGYLLQRVPVPNYEQNEVLEQYDLHIENSTLVGKVRHFWKGESKEDILMEANAIHKNKLDESIRGFLSQDNADYKMSEVKEEGLNNRNADLSFHYDLQFNNAATIFDKDIYIDLDFRKEFSGSSIDTSARELDYLFGCKADYIMETNLTVPATYKVLDLPAPLEIQRSGYSFSIAYKLEGNVLKYRRKVVIKDVHLPRSGFRQWNEDQGRLKKAYLQQVTLTQK
ncbi:MAG TPA: transglutaminase domain-containing protein [Puia sp.]|nr:transglutaminase domain-containing protein [Puia sp.]